MRSNITESLQLGANILFNNIEAIKYYIKTVKFLYSGLIVILRRIFFKQ